MTSLRARLFIGLTAFIAAFSILAGVLSYRSSFDEAIELQDGTLLQIAAIIRERPSHQVPVPSGKIDDEARIVIEEIGRGGFPTSLLDGLHTVAVRGEQWRVFARTLADGTRIAVGQPTAVRDEVARGGAIHSVFPLMILVPCLLIVVAGVIRLTLRPVSVLSHRLDAQQARNLAQLPRNGIPQELLPFVDSINRLMKRLDQVMLQQRHFIADAAHELRSPVTALSLQVQTIDASALPPAQRERFDELRAGMSRVARLLDQLLALARYGEIGKCSDHVTQFDVVLKDLVVALLPTAETHSVDLGFSKLEPVAVHGDAVSLSILARNVLDNAIRYTPEGGRIDVSLASDGAHAFFQVDDSGPGIPAADLERVFEPFFRGTQPSGEGNGLGLSIVRGIVNRFNGTIVLSNIVTLDRTGLRVSISIPAIAQPSP